MGNKFERAILAVARTVEAVSQKLYGDDIETSDQLLEAAARLKRVAEAYEAGDDSAGTDETQRLKEVYAAQLEGAEVVSAQVGDDGRIRLALGRAGQRSAYLVLLDRDVSMFGKCEVGPDAGLVLPKGTN